MANFNRRTSKAPCIEYDCKQKKNDKGNRACRECDARHLYPYALDGVPEALEYFAKLDPSTLGIFIKPTINITQNDKSRRRYEDKYYQSSAIIAKERYGIDFDTFGEILQYTYDKEKMQSKVAKIFKISSGTVKYIFDTYGIKTVGGMSRAMRIHWRTRKGEVKAVHKRKTGIS